MLSKALRSVRAALAAAALAWPVLPSVALLVAAPAATILTLASPPQAEAQSRGYMPYLGTWNSTFPYTANDVVVYLGCSYVSLTGPSNKGNVPSSSTANWTSLGCVAGGSSGGSSSVPAAT